MGNAGSRGVNSRRRSNSRRSHPPPPPPPQPEIRANGYVFAATPYISRFPHGPSYYQYPGYYTTPPPQRPPAMPASYVVHQKAKENLRIEPDEKNPGKYLVAFTFDATVSGSLTVIFFGKEGEDCLLTPMKESLLPPITIEFQQAESSKDADADVYPLAVKVEAIPVRESVSEDENAASGSTNSQLTLAVFEKDKGEYHVRVVKQIFWVNGMRYELQEIYGIGDSIDNDFDGNDPGKECVICLSEPRDTTVLPCRHMCMCSGCAKVLRIQTNRCPICRQPVERLLEI
ncbi:hypothetical protein R3W88_027848 [Solanum pinnatisectum]|uniref:RING-type E3 ubiquitin transferase n=1 Tax=Solanum pinnatisectum TaxID=50273 RepID=A0AAV9LIG9_9SOLN|nr:hypothetical protein R3W88_027848 [Solanum pinnatisectum]